MRLAMIMAASPIVRDVTLLAIYEGANPLVMLEDLRGLEGDIFSSSFKGDINSLSMVLFVETEKYVKERKS